MSRVFSLTRSSWQDAIPLWKIRGTLTPSRSFSGTSTAHRVQAIPTRPPSRSWQKPQFPIIPRPPGSFNNIAVAQVHPDVREDVSVEDVPTLLKENASEWAQSRRTLALLNSFGLMSRDAAIILDIFVQRIQEGKVLSDLQYRDAELSRMAFDLSRYQLNPMLRRYWTKLLYEWAAHPTGRFMLRGAVPAHVLDRMNELFKVADLSKPHTQFPIARASPRRKIIMHVGPTNSGKTHHALRALASAKRGLYAGPLRLLAHEIWERLNTGKIVPLEVTDPNESLRVSKDGDPKYARVCNMLTGEEQKIVDPDAELISCTIEMVPYVRHYDVVVVDEVQMITNSERGGAWTTAILGMLADEIHLCGEETAVPLIQEMLRDTEDELIVNRYERLTPLEVAKTALGQDFKALEPGDCIVTFSHNQLWELKQNIENSTGYRCAVVYGRLPPETRNDQALLFNDQDSGYDILIGSDAIGMGLNLRIKRIVFEAVHKFDGYKETVLSVSQIKQIAGRAGRFGLHGADSSGGIATTMVESDLAVLREAMSQSLEPLRTARLSCNFEVYSAILNTLPSNTSARTIAEVFEYVSKLHPAYEMEEVRRLVTTMYYIDALAPGLSLSDRILFQLAPVPWRDQYALKAIGRMMLMYHTKLRVEVETVLRQSGMWDVLEDVSKRMVDDKPPPMLLGLLMKLESVHKVMSLYLWLSYRVPIAFFEQEQCFEIKQRVEHGIAWCLSRLTKKSKGTKTLSVESLIKKGNIAYKSNKDIQRERREKLESRKRRVQENRLSTDGKQGDSPEWDRVLVSNLRKILVESNDVHPKREERP